jgi:membrane associated rhomboid family serine protease
LLIYFASVIGGSLTSVLTTPGAYLGVGASGGTSGIFGALLPETAEKDRSSGKLLRG